MTQTATDFGAAIRTAYTVGGPAIDLGRGVHDGAVVLEAVVQVPLSMMNRHGLVAGATGTGKTTTLRGLAEQLSTAGVSVFVADMKGDLSGLAIAGAADGPAAKRDADRTTAAYRPPATAGHQQNGPATGRLVRKLPPAASDSAPSPEDH